MIAAGADRRLAFKPKGSRIPKDADRLVEYAKQHEAKLVVINPLLNFLDREHNAFPAQDVGDARQPLAEAADELDDIAFLAVLHLNKVNKLRRGAAVANSAEFKNLSRLALIVARDPHDPDGERGDRRALAQFKANYAKLSAASAFRIEGHSFKSPVARLITTQRAINEGEADVHTGELLAPQTA